MGILGFSFISKKERERRQNELKKRLMPFGVEAQQEKQKELLKELFPGENVSTMLFAFCQAKDAYVSADDSESGYLEARYALQKIQWIDARAEKVLLRFVELETAIETLDDYPTKQDVIEGL